ncbi:hypothetical protein ACFW2D_02745 [Streptomyces sp. NPDC058914]|uniref:hypothetical protein n=1 Tax=Streptomyces TaxID=1883 RepID=UPI0036B78B9B
MEATNAVDSAAAARHARFGKLPERIPFDDMVQVQPMKHPAQSAYDPANAWSSYNCVAAELAL